MNTGNPEALSLAEGWSAAGDGYARHVGPVIMEAFVDAFVDRLDVDAGMAAVEVAAGSGALTHRLARTVGSLVATDFAPRMIDILRERVRAEGLDNVTCELMDGQNLTFKDGRFDRAACSFGLMFFPDRVRGFSELCRVLRSGGRALVSGWAEPAKLDSFLLFVGAIQKAFPDMPLPPPPPVLSLSDPDRFRSEMQAGGFTDVEIAFVTRDATLADFDALWAMLTVGSPPVRSLFAEIGEGGKARIAESLAEIVEERFGTGPITLSNTAIVGTGFA